MGFVSEVYGRLRCGTSVGAGVHLATSSCRREILVPGPSRDLMREKVHSPNSGAREGACTLVHRLGNAESGCCELTET